MLKALAKVSTQKDLTKQIEQSLQSLGSVDVYVGIPEGDVGSHEDITNPELMYILTHGVRSKEMREEMNEYMGLTPGGMPVMRDFDKFSQNMTDGMPYSAAYDLYLHENGSPLWHSPPRPVLEPSIENSKDKIAEKLSLVAKAALSGGDIHNALRVAGEYGVRVAKDWFYNPLNLWPPNSEVTIKGSKPGKNGKKFIKGKNSARPNIDTANLRNSITYVVAKKP